MGFVTAAIAIGSTAYGAYSSNKAANRAEKAAGENRRDAQILANKQSKADDAGRLAKSRQLIAEVQMGNRKIEDLKRAENTMFTQAKADKMLKSENFNKSMAIAMVKGAASGRVLGVGSVQAGFNRAHEDFAWEQMWDNNNLTQNLASFTRDRENLLEAGVNTLKWGAENLELQRIGSSISLDTQAFNAQSAFNNSMVSANNARDNANTAMVQGLASFGQSMYSYSQKP